MRKTLKERFDNFVYYAIDGCWYWTSYVTHDGYGRISVNGKCVSATRVSYTLHKGEFPMELDVLHSCDNPACVNPDHLFLGTAKDNLNDMLLKGRSNKAKLTPDDIVLIRQSNGSLAQVSKEFGVSRTTISEIKNNKIWTAVKPSF